MEDRRVLRKQIVVSSWERKTSYLTAIASVYKEIHLQFNFGQILDFGNLSSEAFCKKKDKY